MPASEDIRPLANLAATSLEKKFSKMSWVRQKVAIGVCA